MHILYLIFLLVCTCQAEDVLSFDFPIEGYHSLSHTGQFSNLHGPTTSNDSYFGLFDNSSDCFTSFGDQTPTNRFVVMFKQNSTAYSSLIALPSLIGSR